MTEVGKRLRRVVFVDSVGAHGSLEDLGMAVCAAVARRGVHVVYATSESAGIAPDGVEVWHPFSTVWKTESRLVRGVRYVVALARVIARVLRWGREGPIVVHYQLLGPWVLDLLSAAMLRRFGIPCVVTLHDVVALGARTRASLASPSTYRNLDAVILPTRAALDAFQRFMGPAIPPTAVIPLGHLNDTFPDALTIDRRTARQALGLPRDVPIILFFGTMKANKGIEVLLRAMPLVAQRVPDVRLLVGSDLRDQSPEPYESLARDLGITDRVIFRWGFVPHDQMPLFFRAADLVALPYLTTYQSGVCPRAYAFERPVVASAVGGIVEQVVDGRTGYLVPPGDPAELAGRVADLLGDPERAARMGRDARAWAADAGNHDAIGEATLEVYLQAMQGAQRRHRPASPLP